MERKITGVMVYYYKVCHRKLWYFAHEIAKEDKGARRWRRVFGICKRYISHIQKSVFEGDITPAQLTKLEYEIKKEINEDLDSVIIFKSRNERWLDKEIIGFDDNATSNFL